MKGFYWDQRNLTFNHHDTKKTCFDFNHVKPCLDLAQLLLQLLTLDTKVKHISFLILKLSFLTLFGYGVKIHQINPIFG